MFLKNLRLISAPLSLLSECRKRVSLSSMSAYKSSLSPKVALDILTRILDSLFLRTTFYLESYLLLKAKFFLLVAAQILAIMAQAPPQKSFEMA